MLLDLEGARTYIGALRDLGQLDEENMVEAVLRVQAETLKQTTGMSSADIWSALSDTRAEMGLSDADIPADIYQQHDGEWVQPENGYRLQCCDCGLVHRMQFRVVDGRVQFRAWRTDTCAALERAKGEEEEDG